MGALEQEIEQLHDAMVTDFYALIHKYQRIIGWDIPENDEPEALEKIIEVMKEAIVHVEEAAKNMERVEVIGDDF